MFAERSLDLSRTFVSCEVIRGLYNISPQATYNVFATKNSKITRKRTSKNTGREGNGPGIMWLPFFCVATPKKGGLVGWRKENKVDTYDLWQPVRGKK